MKKKHLKKWFDLHPAISIRQIGVEAGYKNGQYFSQYMKKGNKKNMNCPHCGESLNKTDEAVVPSVLWAKIFPVLRKYGLTDNNRKGIF